MLLLSTNPPACLPASCLPACVQLLSDMAAFSAAWRNFPRREAAAGRLAQAFGGQAMEQVYSSTAGSQSVRLPSR
jgi:hypothetical protein